MLLAFVSLGADELEGQHRRDRREPSGATGRGFFQLGMMRLDIDELNERLATSGFPSAYPEMEGEFLTLGLGGYGGPGRVLIGAEGHALLPDSEDTAGGERRVSLAGGYGLVRLGYRMVAEGGLEIFPLVGLGGGGLNLRITDRSSPTFDDVLNDPARSSSLTSGMLLLDAALGTSYRFGGSRRGARDGGLHVGLHVGYTVAPGEGTWRLDAINDVASAPDVRLQGLYIRGSVGRWGRADRN